MSGKLKARGAAGIDFLTFLGRNSIALDGLTKDKLKHIYNNEYKQYKSKSNFTQIFFSFDIVMDALFTIGQVHCREEIIYIGTQQNSQTAEKSKNKQEKNKQSIRKESSASQRETQRPISRKQTTDRIKAVDQHLIFKRTKEKSVEGASADEDPGSEPQVKQNYPLPVYVHKTKYRKYSCKPCRTEKISEHDISFHLNGRRHMRNVLNWEMSSNKEKLTQDKNGLTFKEEGCRNQSGRYVIDVEEKERKTITINIYNREGSGSVKMIRWEMLKLIPEIDVEVITNNTSEGLIYEISVSVETWCIGNYHTIIGFLFVRNEEYFLIAKSFHVRCRNEITEILKPTEPYIKPTSVVLEEKDTTKVPGLPPPGVKTRDLKKEFNQVPRFIRRIINRGLDPKGFSEKEKLEINQIRQMLVDAVNEETYAEKFTKLLHIEEVQMEVDIRLYDKRGVSMTKCPDNHKLLVLKVPGLAENRPSVLRGDCLFVRTNKDGQLSKKEYQGYVHEVRQDEVVLGFSETLMAIYMENMKFNVEFVFNRYPITLQHRACQMAMKNNNLQDVMFPTSSNICTRGTHDVGLKSIRFYNRDIESNPEQGVAIQNILLGTSRPSPYLIFGPPGTGKTITIVEAMMQIWKCFDSPHILACAPSNCAADLLVQRLLKSGMQKSHILRMYAQSRPWTAIPEKIREVCNFDRVTHEHIDIQKEDLKKYRVVVCTLITAGRIVSANIESGHFTHIFVDEAGYAIEPECMIPIAGMSHRNIQIVLAGDPKQLGPVIRSPFAKEYGLGMSLLERLMTSCSVYKPTKQEKNQTLVYDNRVITKLLKNYRSHPEIIKLPNEMFYDGELQYCANKLIRESFCSWDALPNNNFPVIFHGVVGNNEQEKESPSFFNAVEAVVVVNYVEKILKKRTGVKIKTTDIGIISPYRKQVQKIQKALKKKNINGITVGSVEEFQGQEKLVIIVSIVRSNPGFQEFDKEFDLGFVENEKRFNVALTRAKALLIVVGNPFIFEEDKNWVKFLYDCENNGSYLGVDRNTKTEDVIKSFNSLRMTTGEEDYISESKPWRADE